MREYLISLRDAKGLTQQQAASKLLISQNYLSQIESGSRQQDLKLSTIKGFAKLYDVSVEQLIAEEAKYKQDLQDTEE